MATLQQLETALVNADKAGDADAARRLAAAVKAARADSASQIPGTPADMGGAVVQPEAPGIIDRAIGVGEAALSTLTGIPAQAMSALAAINESAGAVAQGLMGNYERMNALSQAKDFEQVSRAMTYQPRTQAGQEALGVVADVGAGLVPLAGLGGELAAVAQAGRAARTAAPASTTARAAVEGTVRDVAGSGAAAGVSTTIDAAAAGAKRLRETAAALPQRTRELVFGADDAAPTAGTMGSAGAAGTDMAAQRIERAESLGFTGDKGLTTGQATRDYAQQAFEREQAKMPGQAGEALRTRAANQNAHLAQRLDAEIDNVGAMVPDLREAAKVLDSALVQAAAESKRGFRKTYRAADEAGELRAPVNLDTLINYLNDAAPEATTAPLISTARNLAIKLGIAKDEGGRLVPVRGGRADSLTNTPAPNRTTLKTAETFRQAINRNIGIEPTNIRQGTIIKQLIDEATEGQGGDLYRQARKERQRHAQLFEDNAIVSDLLATRRGTADRKVALGNVFERTVLNGSRDDLSMLRRTLGVSDQRAGFKPGGDGPGAQAWREIQGSTLRHLLEKATENVGKDVAGNDIFSAAKLHRAVTALDRDQRLDFILGKQRAALVRDLNEVARDVLTSPPGSVNTSNTASAVMAAIAEAGITGSMTGLPVPVLSTLKAANSFVRDVKLQRRVNSALAGVQRTSSKTPATP